MPPLNLMREALFFCRNWLWRHQWNRKFNETVKELPKEVFEVERNKRQALLYHRVQEVFALFHNWRKRDSNTREISLCERESSPFKQMINYLANHTEEFIQVFVQCCLTKRIKPSSTVKLKFDIVSDHEQNYYYPVMQILNDKNVLPYLLLEITRNISDSSLTDEKRSYLSGWADKLLLAFLQIGSPRFATVSDQTWKTILKHVVMAPQFFHEEQIEKILAYMQSKLPEKLHRRLAKLLKIGSKLYGMAAEDENLNISTYSVMTIHDLQAQINCDRTFIKDPLTGEDDWSFADMEDLGPLGLTAEQDAETLSLALNKDGSIPGMDREEGEIF